jgi:hypothetical protein
MTEQKIALERKPCQTCNQMICPRFMNRHIKSQHPDITIPDENPSSQPKWKKAYYSKPDTFKAYRLAYYESHKEQIKERNKAKYRVYYKENADMLRAKKRTQQINSKSD